MAFGLPREREWFVSTTGPQSTDGGIHSVYFMSYIALHMPQLHEMNRGVSGCIMGELSAFMLALLDKRCSHRKLQFRDSNLPVAFQVYE